uniref:Solute carrier family 12 member 9 n=1 Tax=Romanomermis culicivorax TaxID=13658 RepID=A0A915KWR9_ROMCU
IASQLGAHLTLAPVTPWRPPHFSAQAASYFGVRLTLARVLLWRQYEQSSNLLGSVLGDARSASMLGVPSRNMISRALGPEFGGSIGVLFFLANIFSCALSLAGLSEATINNFGPGGYMASETIHALPTGHWYHFGYAFCISTVTSSFNYTGLSSTTFGENLFADWGFDYTTHVPMNFPYVFGVVFSGVTGLMAGANMSGDLKKPDISIPRGTLQAIFGTFFLYSITALLLAASCSRDLLKNDYTVVQNINIWPPLIFIGIFATSLASAMSNLIGASRILHRVAEDKLFGAILFPFLKLMCSSNPVNAVFFSWVLVICVLLIGALNAIAQITSVFFLLCYAGVNLACLALDLTSAPNFRPTFYYFSWHTASLGFIGSIGMMFIINPGASGVAIISLLLILIGLHYKAPIPASWGSISQALIFHQVRKYLLMLDTRKEHVKYWRPQILLLVANPKSCLPLIDFVNDLKKSGLYVLGHVKLCSNDMLEADPLQEETPYWLGLIDYLKIKAFVDITVSTSVRQGVQNLVRLSGLGAMKPNTVIFGFRDQTPSLNTFRDNKLFSKKNLKFAKLDRAEVVEYFTARDLPASSSQPSLFLDSDSLDVQRSMDAEPKVSAVEYVHIIADVLRMNKNICLARHFHKLDKETLFGKSSLSPDQERFIDVWPVDLIRPQNASTSWDNSSLFLLQLACILSMVDAWKAKTTLRVFLCVTSLQDMQRKELQLKEMLGQLRIQAKSILLPWDHVICHVATHRSTDDLTKMSETYLRSFNDLLQKNSGRSSVIFLNMPLPVINFADLENFPSECETYLECLETLTNHLPPILLVHGISSVISTAL